MKQPERLARTVIYENPWVNLYADKVRFPDGRTIEKHHILEFEKEAVAVLVENIRGEILFVHAYRYTTGSIEWEIPAGGVDSGEDIIQAAKREALEETGCQTADHQLLYTYHPMNGISNKVFHIVKARATTESGEFDRNEVKAVKWLAPVEIRRMIAERTISDGFSLTALLLYFFRNEN
ncbi:MAG TPA: NUDIX hydrolase [Chloroflexi bacterium]|nr:NUDIX hydrolase [Chloroflexota bacterium]